MHFCNHKKLVAPPSILDEQFTKSTQTMGQNMSTVKKSMYHPDLQSSYVLGRIVIWIAKRRWGLRCVQFAMRAMVGSKIEGVSMEQKWIASTTTPGHSIRVVIYKPVDWEGGPLPAMMYTHGGGYQTGVPEMAHPFMKDCLSRRNVAIIAPDYRLSLDDPFPAGHNDCYDTLVWMKENAEELGIRKDKYILAGHSAGGGMAAALALKVRDTKAVDIAFQMPMYPMLDCRMQTESAKHFVGTLVWDRDTNALAWDNYIGHLQGEIPYYASPSLCKDLRGLPPTISFVGTLEPFKDEVINFMRDLEKAGVPTSFKVYDGGFHGFEDVAADAPIAKEAMEWQISKFAEYYDKFVV